MDEALAGMREQAQVVFLYARSLMYQPAPAGLTPEDVAWLEAACVAVELDRDAWRVPRER